MCPGRESHSSFPIGDVFTPLPAEADPMVVNIGNMLSKDPSKSHVHAAHSIIRDTQLTCCFISGVVR